MRRIARHIYHVGMILIFVLVAIAGFTQTKAFKSYLLGTLLNQVNGSVQGTVWVSSLDGNLITGLRLRDIEVAADGEELARIAEIRVSYDLVGFLLGNVRFSEVEIVRPSVFLYRGIDEEWNLDRFLPAPSGEVQDSVSTPPIITVRHVRVEDARFRMVDSVSLSERRLSEGDKPRTAVDYADLDVSLLHLQAGGSISQMGTRIELESMSFDLPRHDISVKKISGIIELLGASTRIEDLEIVTDRSTLDLDASLAKGLKQIGSVADLRGINARLMVKGQDLDLRELRQFLYPHIEFLDRSVNLDLRVSGTFDRLAVDRLALRTPASFIQMRGVVSNLDGSSDLRLDIEGDESVARFDDIQALLPGLTLPSWGRFGDVTFFFSFNGLPVDFDARVSATSERGSLDADGHLTIGKYLTYNGKVLTERFDLGGFLGDGTEMSRLNATIDVDGSGTSLDALIAVAKVSIDSSTMRGIGIDRSIVILDAAQGEFSGHIDAVTEAGAITVSGRTKLDMTGSVLSYAAQGQIRGADMVPLTGISPYRSDLNFDFVAGGEADAVQRKDTVRLSFLQSTFGNHSIGSSAVNIRQERSNGERLIVVESVPATVQIAGTYEPEDLPILGEYALTIIEDHAERTFSGLDALRTLSQRSETHALSDTMSFPGFDTSDVRVLYEFRSVEPIAALLGITLTGDARGSLDLAGSENDFQVSGRLSSRYFDFDDPTIRIAGKNTSLDFFADRLRPGRMQDHAGTSVTLNVDALRLNETVLSGVAVRTDVQDSVGMLSVGALIDSTVRVSGIGSIRRTDRFTEFVFDEFRVEAHSYSVQTMDSVVATLASDGVLLNHAVFGSDDEQVSVSGIFDPTGISDLRIGFAAFRASHIPDILSRSSTAETVAGLTGRLDGSLLFRGSLNHPNIEVDLIGQDIRLDEVRFGRINAQVGYFERLLRMNISLAVTEGEITGTPELLLRGTVPYDFSLAGPDEEEPLDGEIDLTMLSTGINLRFFQPFLGSVTRDLEGVLTCDIRMTGNVNEPQYEGMATIRNAEFLFVPTRMVYRLDGNFRADGDRIRLQNVVIRNTQADYANGLMNVSGSLSLAGIALQRFDLGFTGELRLMREDSSRVLGNPYYGDLTAATSGQGLAWQGTVDRSKLSGQMLVRNAQLTLPPDREGQQYSTRLIDIIRETDSLGARARFALTARDNPFTVTNTGTVQEQPSFVDRIDFDLSIETQGSTQIRFIFNTQANDVLFADLRGRLAFLRDQTSTRLIGDIEVTDRSYYNFLKRFSASGRLLFTGDPLNPELNIVARYQGIHKKVIDGGTTSEGTPRQTIDERTTVVLFLEGPRSKLATRFDIEVEDPNSTDGFRRLGQAGGNTDVEGDAIAFIMTGQFRDELTEQERTAALGQNLGYGLASGLLTGPLSETLRRTTRGSIQSLDVIYYGGGQFSQGADVRVSGQLGDAVYRVGGRVFDSIDNTNVIVEIPLSALLNSNELRNLVLTLERRVEGTETLEDQRRSSNEARLQYRIRF